MVEPNRGISTSLLVLFFLLFLFFGFIYGQNFVGEAYGACVFMLGLREWSTHVELSLILLQFTSTHVD